MEKYYDGDQDFFFREAHVINPFNKPTIVTKPKAKKNGTEECEICFLYFPPNVSTQFYFFFYLVYFQILSTPLYL